MFLIEYEKGSFINGSSIDWIHICAGVINFTLSGDSESAFRVAHGFESMFLNHLQSLNDNIVSVEGFYASCLEE